MTALSEIQRDWIENTERGEMTGVLFRNLSAAFDTLGTGPLCQKLEIYGCDAKTCDMFKSKSFLTGRMQRVKIGVSLSDWLELESGVLQGGILSPMIFTIYCADIEECVKFSKMTNYPDDTSSCCEVVKNF